MASQNTQVKEQLRAFQEMLGGISFQSEEAAKTHEDFLRSLKNLVEETDRFYSFKDGEYPKMNKASFDHFMHLYQDVIEGMGAYRTVMSGLDGVDKEKGEALALMMDPIQDILGQDLVVLGDAKGNENSTLPELVEQARTRTIDITGKELSKVGANMSSRIKLTVPGKNGDEIGFFTESVYSDRETEMQAAYERAVQKNPGIAALMECITAREWDTLYSINAEKKLVSGNPDHAFDDCFAMEPEQRDKLFVGTGLALQLEEYLEECNKIKNKYDLLEEGAGIEKNEALDKRNNAMSTVANLLGMRDMLAHSESMELINGDKRLKGSFMRAAQGIDCVGSGDSNNIALRPDVEIDTSSDTLKKQLADLQVLDFICGNVDRHAANVFYQFDQTDSKHPRLIGVQGIDNDCSFGTIERGYKYLSQVENMAAVREDTAKTVLSLNEDMLKTMLRSYNFSDKELQAAWNRTRKLQDAIKEGAEFYRDKAPDVLEKGHVRILKEDEWDTFGIDKLAQVGNDLSTSSYFDWAKDVQINSIKSYYDRERKVSLHACRESVNEVYGHKTGIGQMIQRLKRENRRLLGGSEQYNNIIEKTANLEKLYKEMYDSPDGLHALKEGCQKTIEAADAYLKYKMDELNGKLEGKKESEQRKILKKFQDPDGRNYKRMTAASEMISKLQQYEKQVEILIERKDRYTEVDTCLNMEDNELLAHYKKTMTKEKTEEKAGRVQVSFQKLSNQTDKKQIPLKKAPEEAKDLERRAVSAKALG